MLSPSITGSTGLCRITGPPPQRHKLQHFIHWHTASPTLTTHNLLTSHSDVDGVTAYSLSALTPVNTTVPSEDVGNGTNRIDLFSPPISTPTPLSFGRVPPHSPSSRAVLSLTAQRQKVTFKQLRAAGAHSQTSCGEDMDYAHLQNPEAAIRLSLRITVKQLMHTEPSTNTNI